MYTAALHFLMPFHGNIISFAIRQWAALIPTVPSTYMLEEITSIQ